MKRKCPNCNLCLDIACVANRKFFNCFLCGKTFDLVDNEFKEIREIVLGQNDKNKDIVERIIYRDETT
jgi:hypothetical protein